MNFGRRGRERTAANEDFEYYEDTHNERGEYIGSRAQGNKSNDKSMNYAMPMGSGSQKIIVYYPKTPEDVMVLIKHLKMNNPAVVNLDDIDEDTAQRIIDFLAGAVCALSGTAHRISGNLFLLSPKGVEITIPYEQK